jgi:hypothetical protein
MVLAAFGDSNPSLMEFEREIAQYLYYENTIFIIAIVMFIPGIYGFVRTKAWRRKRLWFYIFLNLWLYMLGGCFEKPLAQLWASFFIPMLIVAAMEIPCILFGKMDKKLAMRQLGSLLLCLPLL